MKRPHSPCKGNSFQWRDGDIVRRYNHKKNIFCQCRGGLNKHVLSDVCKYTSYARFVPLLPATQTIVILAFSVYGSHNTDTDLLTSESFVGHPCNAQVAFRGGVCSKTHMLVIFELSQHFSVDV